MGWQRTAAFITAALLGTSVLTLSGTAASAAPDPELFPTVIEMPSVPAAWSGPGTASSAGSSNITLPVGSLPEGTAKVLNGEVLNTSSTDLCIFATARASLFSSSPAAIGANATLLESEGLPEAVNTLLPAPAYPSIRRTDQVVTSSTTTADGWVCDFGNLVAPGESFSYSVTIGVPIGGTAINNENYLIRLALEAAAPVEGVWDDSRFYTGALLNSPDDPLLINASAPSTDWDFPDGMNSGIAYAGRALGAYGRIVNDTDQPVILTFAGFEATGTLARFLLSDLDEWSEPVTVQPGESTGTFFMKLGSPESVGNESQQTTATIRFGWNAEAVAVEHTVAFDANGGEGAMNPQTASAPENLAANAFSREGYEFSGWNTEPDGSGTAYGDGATFEFDRSLTLYAQWEAIPAPGPDPTPEPEPTPDPTPSPDPAPSPTPGPSPAPTQPPLAGSPGLASSLARTGTTARGVDAALATLALLAAGAGLLLRGRRARNVS